MNLAIKNEPSCFLVTNKCNTFIVRQLAKDNPPATRGCTAAVQAHLGYTIFF